MITAKEAREMTKTTINGAMVKIEERIRAEAGRGGSTYVFEVPSNVEENIEEIQKILEENGYEVKLKTFNDWREGSYRALTIRW